MPRETKYHYWQAQAYRPVYFAFMSLRDKIDGSRSRIATVRRYGQTWYSIHPTAVGAEGKGKTRDASVDDLLSQIGGAG